MRLQRAVNDSQSGSKLKKRRIPRQILVLESLSYRTLAESDFVDLHRGHPA
jgi:hypothetical protein